jgi:hypothetical protein
MFAGKANHALRLRTARCGLAIPDSAREIARDRPVVTCELESKREKLYKGSWREGTLHSSRR